MAAAGISRRSQRHAHGISVLSAVFLTAASVSMAQTAYKFRDASGQWVFTDRATTAVPPGDSFSLGHELGALHLAVERYDDAESTQY